MFWLYIASLIGEDGYGEISFLLASAAIAGTISTFGSGDTLTVYRAKNVNLQSTIFFLVILFSIISSIVTFFVIQSYEVSIYIVGFAIFSLAIYELLGRKLYQSYSKYFITQRILAIGLALALYHLIGINGIVLGYGLSFLPYSVTIYKGFRESKIDFSLLKPRFGFMMSSYARSLLQVFGSSLDKVIIFPLFGAALLGNYQLGFQVFIMLGLLPGIVFQYVLPQDSSGKSHLKLKKLTVIISAIVSLIAVVSAPYILPILFPEFTESVTLVQIMSLNVIPSSVSLMLTSKFMGQEKIKIVLIGQLSGLVVFITGIFLLGEIYGINGTAASFVLGGITASLYFVIVNKVLKK